MGRSTTVYDLVNTNFRYANARTKSRRALRLTFAARHLLGAIVPWPGELAGPQALVGFPRLFLVQHIGANALVLAIGKAYGEALLDHVARKIGMFGRRTAGDAPPVLFAQRVAGNPFVEGRGREPGDCGDAALPGLASKIGDLIAPTRVDAEKAEHQPGFDVAKRHAVDDLNAHGSRLRQCFGRVDALACRVFGARHEALETQGRRQQDFANTTHAASSSRARSVRAGCASRRAISRSIV